MKHIVEQLYDYAVEILEEPSLSKKKVKERKILARRIKEQIENHVFYYKNRKYKVKVFQVMFYVEYKIFGPPNLCINIIIKDYRRLSFIRSQLINHIRSMFRMWVWCGMDADEKEREKELKNEFVRERVKVLLCGKEVKL